MSTTLDFCTRPTGYSERAYNDTSLAACYPYPSDSDTTGYHNLCTTDCRVNFYWPRASTGAPSYARIDLSGTTATAEPDLTFNIQGEWDLGNFSWGTANVGLGSAGAGHDFLAAPLASVQFTGDDDIAPSSRAKFRGAFYNTAGTLFTTAWTELPATITAGQLASVANTEVRCHISGSTGYVTLGGGTTASVALSGSFSGDYSRWESWHNGGGGGGSNGGGAGEGNQVAYGAITSLRVGALGFGPTVGFIGLTP